MSHGERLGFWSPRVKAAFARLWNVAHTETCAAVFGLSNNQEARQRARILRREGYDLRDMTDALRIYAPGCSVPGCTDERKNGGGGTGRGMCPTHFMRWRRGDRGPSLARPVRPYRRKVSP